MIENAGFSDESGLSDRTKQDTGQALETTKDFAMPHLHLLSRHTVVIVFVVFAVPAGAHGQGIYINMAGPVNRAMGGASTAAPIDATGALYWNPATISALPTSELDFGFGLLLPQIELGSSVPGIGSGTTDGEPGVTPLPTIGWAQQTPNPSLTVGIGLFPVAGFKTNYPASLTNPILAPQSNAPFVPGGFGRLFSEVEFLQMAPAIAYSLTHKLSIGVGPTITMGRIAAEPLAFAAPDDADGSGVPRYPAARGTRLHWGGGAQIGIHYAADCCWSFGVSVKSPQWMEEFRFKSEDEIGRPRTVNVKADLPLIISAGTAFYGLDKLILALDLRYFDYKNTDGFSDSGFGSDGSLKGLGWSNVFALGAGAQYSLTPAAQLRLGYSFNTSPISSSDVSANIASPLIQQHLVNAGASFCLTENVAFNTAYTYVVQNDESGPIATAAGIVPGSAVFTEVSAHVLSMGLSVTY